MNKLSEVVAYHEIMVNQHGIASILMPWGWIRRKITSKPFSNWSVDTVTINKVKYLIDSQIDVVHVEVKQ